MEALLLGIYGFFVWLIFIKFKAALEHRFAGHVRRHPDRVPHRADPGAERRRSFHRRRSRLQVRRPDPAAGARPRATFDLGEEKVTIGNSRTTFSRSTSPLFSHHADLVLEAGKYISAIPDRRMGPTSTVHRLQTRSFDTVTSFALEALRACSSAKQKLLLSHHRIFRLPRWTRPLRALAPQISSAYRRRRRVLNREIRWRPPCSGSVRLPSSLLARRSISS